MKVKLRLDDEIARLSDALEAKDQRIADLEAVFAHYHVGPDERCGQCGLDLRDPVHRRAVA